MRIADFTIGLVAANRRPLSERRDDSIVVVGKACTTWNQTHQLHNRRRCYCIDERRHDAQSSNSDTKCLQRTGKISIGRETSTGAKFSGKGLDALMRDARRGRVHAVVAYRLDRLGRSLAHLVQIISEMTTHRVALVVPGQAIDPYHIIVD
jgi:hypothetical protein